MVEQKFLLFTFSSVPPQRTAYREVPSQMAAYSCMAMITCIHTLVWPCSHASIFLFGHAHMHPYSCMAMLTCIHTLVWPFSLAVHCRLGRLPDSNSGLQFHNLVSLPISYHCSLQPFQVVSTSSHLSFFLPGPPKIFLQMLKLSLSNTKSQVFCSWTFSNISKKCKLSTNSKRGHI